MNPIYGDGSPHHPELLDVILGAFESANRHCPRCDAPVLPNASESLHLCGQCTYSLAISGGEDD